MHDLLQDLGRYIVHQESQNVGKRSRLWEFDDIKEVLENNKGSKKIQAIVMPDKGFTVNVHAEAFSKMSNIRLLILGPKNYMLTIINLPRGLKLSSALKVVRWTHFKLNAVPLENPLEKLVHIEMPNSRIKQLWNVFSTSISFIELLQRLKSLPRLPPRLIGLHATSCNSMETPLSSMNNYGIWLLHLTMSGRTKYYAISMRTMMRKGHLMRQETPSWFSKDTLEMRRQHCVIKVKIPRDFRDSEWLGIVVCLPVICSNEEFAIYWSTKAPEDDGFLHKKEWGYLLWL
ncbi:hypothetical protein K1719_044319 [Acacia pycnantha]|nr:hypothetical protein K1719_044319 [Acacia pycnantha]